MDLGISEDRNRLSLEASDCQCQKLTLCDAGIRLYIFKIFAMNLCVISEQIVIDRVETINSESFVHFLSRPDDLLRLPTNWGSVVYMSKTTARGLMLKQSPIPMKFIRILEANNPVTINLPDGKFCTVTMFENSGLAESVAFHFKGDKGTALYSGSFTRCRALLLNNLLRSYVLNGIDFLYVDNTAVNSTDPVSQSTAASEILKIANSYPDHRIVMNVPPFGYEDLIYSVVKLAKLKVFAEGLHLLVFEKYNVSKLFESDIREARVIVAKHEVITAETIYRRFTKEKLLTLRIIPCGLAPKNNFEKSGLFQVHWSPHPLLFEIWCLVNYIKPKSVHGIYPSSNMPTFLRGSHQQEKESNGEINNSTIKAKPTENDLIESISDDLQLDKNLSIFDSASNHEGLPGCTQVKQSPEIISQSALKEQLVTISSSRKRQKKSVKEYSKLPKRLRNQKKTDTLEKNKISLNGMGEKSKILLNVEDKDSLVNDKAMQTEKSLSVSTFTSLSLFTSNDQPLNAKENETRKQSDKILPSLKSVSLSTFTSLSSCGDINNDNPAKSIIAQNNEIPLTTSGGKSTKSRNIKKQSQMRSREDKQTKSNPAKRLKTTSKKGRRDADSKPQKDLAQENKVSLSVVSSLTISTFSSLESSLASSIIPTKRKKLSSDSVNGEKSVAVNYKRDVNHRLLITSKTRVTSRVITKHLNLDRLPRRKQSTTNHNASTKLHTQLSCKEQSENQFQEGFPPKNKISGKRTGSRISKGQENICNSLEQAIRPNRKKETAQSTPKIREVQNDPLVELVFSKRKKIAEKKHYKKNS